MHDRFRATRSRMSLVTINILGIFLLLWFICPFVKADIILCKSTLPQSCSDAILPQQKGEVLFEYFLRVSNEKKTNDIFVGFFFVK